MRNPPLCKRWELEDGGRYTIDKLADFNEAMDVEEENERRFEAARKEKRR